MSRIAFPLLPATIGFCVAISLCGYAFYLTSHHEIGSSVLFVALCPPSIMAMSLDNAGAVGGLVGWLFIAFANAGFYALIWAIVPFRRVRDGQHE
jgi:hypothetical protein